MLLHEKPGVVVLSTSAKHLKAWKVDSAVIRIKLETILNLGRIKISSYQAQNYTRPLISMYPPAIWKPSNG